MHRELHLYKLRFNYRLSIDWTSCTAACFYFAIYKFYKVLGAGYFEIALLRLDGEISLEQNPIRFPLSRA